MENISGTVTKAIDVLELFLEGKSELGLTEISELSGYNTTTVYRLLSTMVKRGLIHQGQKKGKYSLGLKTLEFSHKVRRNLNYLDIAYIHLSKLCRQKNVAVDVTVLDGDDQIVVDEIGVVDDFRYTAAIGKRLPLHATACGKIFLAYMDMEEKESFYSRNILEPITKNTITDKDQLNRELEIVNRDGLAFDDSQYIQGTWAVSAPVFSSKNEVVCVVTIVLPTSQVNAYRAQECSTSLKSCTAELSVAISRII